MRPAFALLPLILLAACAQPKAQEKGEGKPVVITPISQIRLPVPTIIKGKVIAKKGTSFKLKDESGIIDVDTDSKAAIKQITIGKEAIVIGVLDEDDSLHKDALFIKEIDAYEVIPEGGKVVRIVPWK